MSIPTLNTSGHSWPLITTLAYTAYRVSSLEPFVTISFPLYAYTSLAKCDPACSEKKYLQDLYSSCCFIFLSSLAGVGTMDAKMTPHICICWWGWGEGSATHYPIRLGPYPPPSPPPPLHDLCLQICSLPPGPPPPPFLSHVCLYIDSRL